MKSIIEAMRERVLLGDGARGTRLQEGGLPAGACPEEAVLSRPSLVAGIHRRYIESGAEVIETNTFGANRRKLADYGLAGEVERINRGAVRLARKAAPGWVYVAGAVGPLGAQLAPLGALTFEEAVEEFGEQLRALARAGVDAVFLETFSDIREAKAALAAASGLPGIPGGKGGIGMIAMAGPLGGLGMPGLGGGVPGGTGSGIGGGGGPADVLGGGSGAGRIGLPVLPAGAATLLPAGAPEAGPGRPIGAGERVAPGAGPGGLWVGIAGSFDIGTLLARPILVMTD